MEDPVSAQPLSEGLSPLELQLQTLSSEKLLLAQDLEKTRAQCAQLTKDKATADRERSAIDKELKKALAIIQKSKDQQAIKSLLDEISNLKGELDLLSDAQNQNSALKQQIYTLIEEGDATNPSGPRTNPEDIADLIIYKTQCKTLEELQTTLRQEKTKLESTLRSLQTDFEEVKEALENERKKNGSTGAGKWWNRSNLMSGQTVSPASGASSAATIADSNGSATSTDPSRQVKFETVAPKLNPPNLSPAPPAVSSSVRSWWNRGSAAPTATATAPGPSAMSASEPAAGTPSTSSTVAPATSNPLHRVGESSVSLNVDVSKHIDQLKIEKANLEERLQHASEEIGQLKIKLSSHTDIQTELDTLRNLHRELEEQFLKADKERSALLSQVETYTSSSSEVNTEASRRLGELQSSLLQKGEEINQLNDALKEQETRLRMQMQAADERNVEVNISYKRALEEVQAASAAKNEITKQLIDVQVIMENKEKHIAELRKRLEACQAAESELQIKLIDKDAELQARIRDAKGATETAQKAQSELGRHIKSLQNEIDTLNTKLGAQSQESTRKLEETTRELMALNEKKLETLTQTRDADLSKLKETHEHAIKTITKKYEEKLALQEESAKAFVSSDSEVIQSLESKYQKIIEERDLQIQELQNSIEEHVSKVSAIETEHVTRLNLTRKDFEESIMRLKALTDGKIDELNTAVTDLERSRQLISEKESESEKAKSTIDSLSKLVSDLKSALQEKESLASQQLSAYSASSVEAEKLKQSISDHEKQLSKMSYVLQDSTSLIEQLRQSLVDKEVIIAEKSKEVERISAEVEASKSALSKSEALVAERELVLRQLESSLAETSSGSIQEHDKLKAHISETESKIKSLEISVSNLTAEKEAFQAQHRKDEETIKSHSEAFEKTQFEVKTLNEQLLFSQQESHALAEKLSQANQTSESLSTSKIGLETEISRLQSEIKAIIEEKLALEKSKKTAEESLKTAGSDSEVKVKTLTVQLVQLQSDKASAEKKLINEYEEKLKKESQNAEENRKKDITSFEDRLKSELTTQEEKFKKEKISMEEAIKKEKAALEEKLKKERSELEDKIKKEKVELENNFNKEKQKLATELDSKKKEVSSLEAFKADLQKKLEKAAADLEKSKKHAQASEATKTEAYKKLEKEYATKNDELSKTLHKIKTFEQEINHLKTDSAKALELSEKKLKDLETDFSVRSQNHEKLQQEHPQLLGQINTLKDQVTNIQAQFDISLAELEVLKGSYERSSKLLIEKDEALKKIKTKVEEVIKSEKILKKTISDTETEKTELQTQVQTLKDQVLELKNTLEEQAAIAREKDKSKELQTEIDSLKADNDSLRNKIEDMESQFKITERKTFTIIKDLQKQLRKEVKLKEGLEEKAESIVDNGAATYKSNLSPHETKPSSKPIAQTGVPKMERLTDDLITLVSENEALNKRAKAAEQELKTLQERYARVHEELDIKSKTIQQFVLRDHAAKLQPDDSGNAQKPAVFNMNILSSTSAMQKMDPVKLSSINVKLQKLVEELTIKMNNMEGELQKARAERSS